VKKYISWNVNGFRAVMNKNAFLPFVEREQPDAICLQETKMQEGQAELTLPG
jgi:exodeoxyribonuclease-3